MRKFSVGVSWTVPEKVGGSLNDNVKVITSATFSWELMLVKGGSTQSPGEAPGCLPPDA